MISILIVAGFTFVVGLLVLRPFAAARGPRHIRIQTSDEVRRRELLRQLRDLDDDLAAGKLTDADHARLRQPVEREAAAVLRRRTTQARTAVSRPQRRDPGTGARRWRRRTVTSLALAAGLASVRRRPAVTAGSHGYHWHCFARAGAPIRRRRLRRPCVGPRVRRPQGVSLRAL